MGPISIERRWNRNEVSRESPDKEVNRRPISLKKFRADALRGPTVSIVIIIIITKTLLTSHTLYFGSFPDQYSLVTSIGGGGMS